VTTTGRAEPAAAGDPKNSKEETVAELDLLIEGGTVVDGTGAPPRAANVGVKDGQIVYVGPDRPESQRTLDARGKMVAPGFIDTHTHYDAQITWDPWLRPHTQHGVTTFISGNCGFALSPVTKESLNYLIPMLAKVEGIPLATLLEGAHIDWSTTGEMLATLDGKVGVNIGFMTGHSTLRAHAMGARARSEGATRADLDAMKALLRQALSEGALGFSSSHIETHVDHEAEGVPSLHASRDELLELMSVVKEFEGTMTGYVLTGRVPNEDDMRFMAEVSLASGRIYSWPLLAPGIMADQVMKAKMSATDVARRMGAEFRVQAPSAPVVNYTNFKSGLGYDQFPGAWNGVYRQDLKGRIAALADPALRPILEADALKIPEGENTKFLANWGGFEVQSVKSEKNRPYVGRLIRDIAAEQGRGSFDVLMDIVVEDELATVLVPADLTGDEHSIWKGIVECMRDDRTLWGGDDGGAHLDMLEAYSHGTRFIQKAVREYGLMPIEEAVHHFTQVPALFIGLKDRGVIASGMHADIVVFDLDRVRTLPVEMRADFPAQGERLFTGSEGFEHVLVNGEAIISDGEYTGALPGTVLRARRDTYTADISLGADVTRAAPLLAAE
jgi:N-acyl-D-aspartate/D-glutamate deacylase